MERRICLFRSEWKRNVEADYPDITWEDLQRVRELMDKALPGA